MATVRASPFYWRVHVFGDKASAESRGELELLIHRGGAEPERRTFEPVDALRQELEVFADAIEGYRAFPVSAEDMLSTVAAFEAAVKALESSETVQVTPV
jgi:predicted dehydrogenase